MNKLLIENESGKDVTVQAWNVSVNGYMMDTSMSAAVVNGKKANDGLTIMSSSLKKAGISTIADIEFSFHVFETHSFDSLFDSDLIQLKTSVLNTKIPDCDGRGNKKSSSWVPMLDYLDPALKTQYESLLAEGSKTAFTTVFDNNNLRLVIEPIHWSYTYLVNPKDPDPNKRGAFFKSSYGSPEIIYGTVSKGYNYTVQQYQKSEGARLGISGFDWVELVNYI